MKLYGWLGLLLLIASEYCLVRQIEPVTTWFYCFAWWSYILLADNLLLKLRGSSLLSSHPRKFLGMLPISVFIWLIFEAYNFSIRNWAYIEVPSQAWLRWPGYVLAFSTVLPGIFITSDLVELLFSRSPGSAASECRTLSSRPSTKPSGILILLGLALTIAPLVWPRYFFAAVWIGPIFLLDPLLEKAGLESLSLGISTRNRRRVWSLLSGGFLCGVMWEFWNFWAGSKWVYSVPFFGQWKIFEMPTLGFLGFPPFALECWILYHLFRVVPEKMDFRAARIVWWIGWGILSIIIIRGIDHHTVISFSQEFVSRSSTGG